MLALLMKMQGINVTATNSLKNCKEGIPFDRLLPLITAHLYPPLALLLWAARFWTGYRCAYPGRDRFKCVGFFVPITGGSVDSRGFLPF